MSRGAPPEKIIDGKALAEKVRREVGAAASQLRDKKKVTPCLAAVLVGDDPASALYVNQKEKKAAEVGIATRDHRLPEATSEADLLLLIESLNSDAAVHGILVQLPLPELIDSDRVLKSVSPLKDVDGFHPENLGLLVSDSPRFVPCTPAGILRMLDHYNVALEGAQAVVVGRSKIVGKPVAHLLLQRHATVTICHSRTRNLPDVIGEAEVLVAAVGRPEFVKGKWIREGAAVIDVGVNRLPEGDPRGKKLVGDVEFDRAIERVSKISPVPGGVGPMTIAMLLYNTVRAARMSAEE